MHTRFTSRIPVLCSGLFFVLLAATSSPALDAIGAAVVNAGGRTSMRLYKIKNTKVDTSYDIIQNWNYFGNTAFPIAINTHGTHLAYIRWSGNMTDNECRVGVLRLSDPSKSVELAWFGLDGGNAWGSKQLCWPQGDWIYFTTANFSKYVYRVNTQTRKIEFVAHINFGEASEFKMSAIGYRIGIWGGHYFTLQDIQAAPQGKLSGAQWPNGAFTVQGCGHTISASGKYMGNQVDPGHYLRIITSLDWENRRMVGGGGTIVNVVDRNAMSVDKDDPFLACTITDPVTSEKIVETVGIGQATKDNAFSVNSDKWECTVSGWWPEGREQGNGGNIILWNHIDRIALNVTRLPRKMTTAQRASIEGSCQNDPNYLARASAPSFVITAPIEDIVPELRADLTTDYKIPGLDDNTQFPALTMMPKTPDGGWPIVPVPVDKPAPRTAENNPATAFMVIPGPSSLRICFSTGTQYSVAVFDVRGTMVARRNGQGSSVTFTSRDGIRPGIYMVRTDTKSRSYSAATVMIPRINP